MGIKKVNHIELADKEIKELSAPLIKIVKAFLQLEKEGRIEDLKDIFNNEEIKKDHEGILQMSMEFGKLYMNYVFDLHVFADAGITFERFRDTYTKKPNVKS